MKVRLSVATLVLATATIVLTALLIGRVWAGSSSEPEAFGPVLVATKPDGTADLETVNDDDDDTTSDDTDFNHVRPQPRSVDHDTITSAPSPPSYDSPDSPDSGPSFDT